MEASPSMDILGGLEDQFANAPIAERYAKAGNHKLVLHKKRLLG